MKSKPSESTSGQFASTTLRASSVGSVAYSRLMEGVEGEIQGAFDGAINVLFPGGLVSLVPERVERGPLNITLRLPTGSSGISVLGAVEGDRVSVRDQSLELGSGRRIVFRSSAIYAPERRFASPMLKDNEIAANLEAMRKTALLFGNRAGLGDLLGIMRPSIGKTTSRKLNIFASAALPRILHLEQAVRSGEMGVLSDAVGDLIGLGPGLTPASDDTLAGLVLVSLLYAENSGRAQLRSRKIAEAVATQAAGRTTNLSEEYLRQAASARGNEPVVRLCAALLTSGRDSVERETRRVVSIGETSGTDTVLGILLGVRLCRNRQSGLARRELR